MSTKSAESPGQSGQTIVLVALLFVILLLFVGIAVDAGFAFVRSSDFSRAVDSASLAGVVDLDLTLADCTADPMALTCPANVRARQFLASNGWPISQTTQFDSSWSYTQFGVPEYTITVTYPVETYLIKLIGIRDFPITHIASAVYYAQTDIYVPTSLDIGQIRKGSQFIVGPDGCADQGDPVVPLSASNGVPNPDYEAFEGMYRYRVNVPSEYVTDTIRVELFDPDSVNLNVSNSATITHSDSYSATNGQDPVSNSCDLAATKGQPCVFGTGEGQSGPTLNPVWLNRVDEYFTSSCAASDNDANGNTQVVYDLYTLDDNGVRQDLVRYTWERTDDPSLTDMKWVTPGVTTGVAVDSVPGYVLSSFDVPFSSLPDNGIGPRYIYMDVYPTAANGGSARNVWDVRAGPPPKYYQERGLPPLVAEVNARNLQLANNPAGYDTHGVVVSAIGRMPIDNHITDGSVSFTLSPIGELRTQAFAYMTLFDYENPVGNPSDITFGVDTDLGGTFGTSFVGKVDQAPVSPSDQIVHCNGGSNCNATWTDPSFIMSLPNDPSFGFGGGNITAEYEPHGDAHTWWLSISAGRPFLAR